MPKDDKPRRRAYRKWGHVPDLAVAYETSQGAMYQGDVERFLASDTGLALRGRVSLLFTSPPYPLNRKKKYGNLTGEKYLRWIAKLAPLFRDLVKSDGSVVIEIGNSWTAGLPTMSTLALEALLAFKQEAGLHLCQQFVCHNPARLPSPAQWVNVERIRVKDSFTHVWWMSPTDRPNADNRRVLQEYSNAMKQLLKSGKYNAGRRPSQHLIGATSFLSDNGGSIPSNVLTFTNTTVDGYLKYCRDRGLPPHPARMPSGLAEFFIKFLTVPRNLIFDPFGGSNVTGAAAESLGRRWISVEANAEYIESSKGRFGEGLDDCGRTSEGAQPRANR